jgi:hypothetical protein
MNTSLVFGLGRGQLQRRCLALSVRDPRFAQRRVVGCPPFAGRLGRQSAHVPEANANTALLAPAWHPREFMEQVYALRV